MPHADSLYSEDAPVAHDYAPSSEREKVAPLARAIVPPRKRRWTVKCRQCDRRYTVVSIDVQPRRTECTRCFERYCRAGGRRW